VESHISPKTSEIWGTQVLLWGKVVRALMGLRPVFINPRTLVRTWGTQTELCEGKNGWPMVDLEPPRSSSERPEE
jgi:hypothetical protein